MVIRVWKRPENIPTYWMSFRDYLFKTTLTERSIGRIERLVDPWLNWLPVEVQHSTYQHLMNYIGYLKKDNRSIHHINRALQAISHYYDYRELPNVAISTRLRGRITKAKLRAFTTEQLDQINASFEPRIGKGYYHYSDHIILGLMIYQALEIGDFMPLELNDVKLQEGKIYIPARGKRLSRTISLESHQVLSLHSYIQEHRSDSSHKLFAPQCDNYNVFHWQYKQLTKEVRNQVKEKLDLDLIKLHQLRQSRIKCWIDQYGVRRTQYLGGYRTILSVERYRDPNLDNLKEQVRKYHPFK